MLLKTKKYFMEDIFKATFVQNGNDPCGMLWQLHPEAHLKQSGLALGRESM
jgi:hypothetical protein